MTNQPESSGNSANHVIPPEKAKEVQRGCQLLRRRASINPKLQVVTSDETSDENGSYLTRTTLTTTYGDPGRMSIQRIREKLHDDFSDAYDRRVDDVYMAVAPSDKYVYRLIVSSDRRRGEDYISAQSVSVTLGEIPTAFFNIDMDSDAGVWVTPDSTICADYALNVVLEISACFPT